MTTTRTGSRHAAPGAATRLTFVGVLDSEWIKLRTLRSTFWCYLIVLALNVLFSLLLAAVVPASEIPLAHDLQQSMWVSAATLGVYFSQLVTAVLGVLVITGEYGTGMIRSTFAAVPGRIPAIVAKAVVFGAATFVVSLVSIVIAALVSAPLLSGKGYSADFGDSQVWVALVGGAGYLAIIGIIALAIGLVIRNTAGGIAAALGLVLVLPIVLSVLAALAQATWASDLGSFLPSSAGGRLYAYPLAGGDPLAQSPDGGTTPIVLDGWQALLVLAGWFAVVYAVGLILVKRRDA